MPIETDEKFVNPYIFLPLEDGCQKNISVKNLKEKDDLLTGWLLCKLTTKSAIFIPNTSYDQTFTFSNYTIDDSTTDFKSHDFFSYTQLDENTKNPKPPKPTIPSSELRAVTHIAYESLTNSCLQIIDERITIHKRLPNPGNPARIYKENKNWFLKECWKAKLDKTKVSHIKNNRFQLYGTDYQEGDQVYVKINNRNNKVSKISKKQTPECNIKGYIHFSAEFGRKRYESIFIESNNKPIEITKEEVEKYMNNIQVYKDNDTYSWIKRGKNHYLVYYKTKNSHHYFKPGEIGRDVFYNSITDILRKKNYNPCVSIDHLCPACSLFGFTSNFENKEKNALASRIRVTDGVCLQNENVEDLYFEKGILEELSGPKIQSTEFYLKRPQYENNKRVDLWTFDYAGNWNGQQLEWLGSKPYEPEICGRKFYWHQKIVTQDDLPYIDKDDDASRKVGVRPLKPNVSFTFKIYFDNITQLELKILIWVLEIGNKDNSYAHKIGMGKPLGLGSIKIEVQEVNKRKVKIENNSLTYEIMKDEEILTNVRTHKNPIELLGCSKNTLNYFKAITDFNNIHKNIEYPKNIDADENYEWFMSNRTIYPGSAFNWKINQHLCNNIDNPELNKYGKGKTQKSDLKEKEQKPRSGKKMTGTIKKIISRKTSFGFITPNDGSEDIFFHFDEILDKKDSETLRERDKVQFEVIKAKKGPQAIKIRKI
ncbi:MAG: putative CRISPR-associated RAMP family protein [Promethearchaeota archaeon]|nr:MAG: putative CRISPR-associated RAMP family protein [Candidatus Lokiarchaeota archaeon]